MIQHNPVIEKEKNIDMLFSLLDEAIDDMENGRVVSEDEMWKRLAEVKDEK